MTTLSPPAFIPHIEAQRLHETKLAVCLLLLMRSWNFFSPRQTQRVVLLQDAWTQTIRIWKLKFASTCPPTAYGRRWLCKFENFSPFCWIFFYFFSETFDDYKTSRFWIYTDFCSKFTQTKANIDSAACRSSRASCANLPHLKIWRDVIFPCSLVRNCCMENRFDI